MALIWPAALLAESMSGEGRELLLQHTDTELHLFSIRLQGPHLRAAILQILFKRSSHLLLLLVKRGLQVTGCRVQ